jgi:hypothetical protein
VKCLNIRRVAKSREILIGLLYTKLVRIYSRSSCYLLDILYSIDKRVFVGLIYIGVADFLSIVVLSANHIRLLCKIGNIRSKAAIVRVLDSVECFVIYL